VLANPYLVVLEVHPSQVVQVVLPYLVVQVVHPSQVVQVVLPYLVVQVVHPSQVVQVVLANPYRVVLEEVHPSQVVAEVLRPSLVAVVVSPYQVVPEVLRPSLVAVVVSPSLEGLVAFLAVAVAFLHSYSIISSPQYCGRFAHSRSGYNDYRPTGRLEVTNNG
jgi:hypothetical protein